MMEEIGKRLATVTVRDLWLFVVCAIAVYLLRVRDSYSLQPVWRMDIDTSLYENKQYAKIWEQTPPPVITDIESDGINEIVIATNEPKVIMAVAPDIKPTNAMLPYLKILHEAPLGRKGDEKKKPVALATGFLVEYQSMLQIRKQVIVVLTADWTVMCFNDELNLMWEQQLTTTIDPEHFIKEAAILITSHSLKKKDGGSVIIGGSMTDKHHHEKKLVHDHHKRIQDINPTDVYNDEDDEEYNERMKKEADAEISHFSTYALSAKDGSIRWHHLPGDFDESVNSEELLHSSHHFKLGLRKGLTHKGESHWSQYNIAMLKSLPHTWQRRSDTKMEISRFQKSRGLQSKDYEDDEEDNVLDFIGLDEEHLVGYAFGGLRPHSPSEHIKNPNAVVLHMHEGIEVLSLSSGQPLCRLKLQQDSGVYVDINHDAVIDHVKAHFTDNPEHEDNCLAVVKSGHPPHTLLFNASICNPPGIFTMLSLTGSLFGGSDHYEEGPHTVPPVIVKSVAERKGVWNHLSGQSHAATASKGYDSVFLLSNGKVTSFGPNGQTHWQVDSSAQWSKIDIHQYRDGHHPLEFLQRVRDAFVPGIQQMPLQIFGKENTAVLTGWDSMVMISLKDGHILAEHSLPCRPSAPVVIGDFDNNGWNDIILVCPSSYIGFSLQRFTGYWSTAAIAAAIIFVVTGLTAIFSNLEEEENNDQHTQDHVS